MEIASVFISAAAFVLAIASLYFTTLRRPKIEVDHLEDHWQFYVSTWGHDHMPAGVLVAPAIFVWNSGAHSGVVQTFKSPGFRCVGADLFGELRDRSPRLQQSEHALASLPPWPIDANDGNTYFIACIAIRAADIADAETYAHRLAKLEAIELDLSWSFRRPKLLRGRRTVTAHRTLTIDCAPFRADVRRHWEESRPDLAELLPAE